MSWLNRFKISNYLSKNKNASVRDIGQGTGIAKSTVQDELQRRRKLNEYEASEFWDSEAGYNFLRRLVVGAIYTFAIKGGVGAGRISEFMNQLQLSSHVGVSESSIQKVIKEIEALIRSYKEARQEDIEGLKSEIEVVLGVDETWLHEMYLVCQELTSGYLFLSKAAPDETQKAGRKP